MNDFTSSFKRNLTSNLFFIDYSLYLEKCYSVYIAKPETLSCFDFIDVIVDCFLTNVICIFPASKINIHLLH
jgi:hypothetical protein